MRNIIDGAIGVSPVSTVDVDSVVAAGRRRTRLRRLVVVGPVAGSAVAVLAIVVLILSTVRPSPAPSAPSVAQPAVTPSAPSGAAPVHSGETPEQTSQRLAAVLTDRLSAALPGVALTEWFGGQTGVLVYHDEQTLNSRFDAGTVLTVAAGQNQVDFVSWAGGRLPAPVTVTDWPTDAPAPPVLVEAWFESCADMADSFYGQAECVESVGPQGQTIVAITPRCHDDECPVGMATAHHVWVTWTNAKVELAINAGTKRGGPVDPPAPPLLTRDQLIAIASDAGLTVGAA